MLAGHGEPHCATSALKQFCSILLSNISPSLVRLPGALRIGLLTLTYFEASSVRRGAKSWVSVATDGKPRQNEANRGPSHWQIRQQRRADRLLAVYRQPTLQHLRRWAFGEPIPEPSGLAMLLTGIALGRRSVGVTQCYSGSGVASPDSSSGMH